MSRPARARDSVLEAYERLLIEEGPRGATMEATAAAAGVSKGGLLYHFASKEALEKGLLERMEALAALDLEEMSAAPEGLIAAFLRTSVMDGSPIDRALIAGSKLAQTASPLATEALRRVRELWAGALRPHARDETAVAARAARLRRPLLQQRARHRRRPGADPGGRRDGRAHRARRARRERVTPHASVISI